MSAAVVIRKRSINLIAAQKLKHRQLSELIRRDMADTELQKIGRLDSYQKTYQGLLFGTGAGFMLGSFGAALLNLTTGIDLISVSLFPSAASLVLLTQSEKLVYLSRLRRGKVAPATIQPTDLGELQAEPIGKDGDR